MDGIFDCHFWGCYRRRSYMIDRLCIEVSSGQLLEGHSLRVVSPSSPKDELNTMRSEAESELASSPESISSKEL